MWTGSSTLPVTPEGYSGQEKTRKPDFYLFFCFKWSGNLYIFINFYFLLYQFLFSIYLFSSINFCTFISSCARVRFINVSFSIRLFTVFHFFWRKGTRRGEKTRRKNNRACVTVWACAEVIANSSGSVRRSGADISVFCQKNFIYFLTLPSSWLFFCDVIAVL